MRSPAKLANGCRRTRPPKPSLSNHYITDPRAIIAAKAEGQLEAPLDGRALRQGLRQLIQLLDRDRPGKPIAARRISDDPHTGCHGCLNAQAAVFDDRARCRRHTHRRSSMKKKVRLLFPSIHVIGTKETILKKTAKTSDPQCMLDLAAWTVRCHAFQNIDLFKR